VILELKLLGEPEFRLAATSQTLKVPRNTWALVALLALRPRPVDRAALATSLWPDADDPRATLRRHIHGLIRALPAAEEWLVSDARTIGWNHAAPCRIDVVEFQKAIADGRFTEAVETYSGDLLGVLFDEAILSEREQLRDLYAQALATLAGKARAQHDYPAATRYAEQLLALDEFREDVVRDLMRIRYESGDRSSAILVYDRFARLLHQETRADPMLETTALRDSILSGTAIEEARLPEEPDSGPFVGRTRDIQSLKSIWNRAIRGTAASAFISGEAGIGKSRLAAEFAAFVAGQNARALRGRTSSPESSAFEAVLEAFRDGLRLLRRTDLDDVWWSALAPLLPEIATLHPDLPQLASLDPEPARIRLREAFARVMVAMSARTPVLIVLEDMHWASGETCELLETLVRRAAAAPILILVTMRLAERGRLDAARRQLQQERKAQAIALARLGDNDIADLGGKLLGPGRFTEEACRRISAVVAGHPLFAVLLLRHYKETGVLPGGPESLATIADAIVRRLERLPEEARALAGVAACFESSFTVEELARVSGWDESRVLDALGTLLAAKIVGERGGSEFLYTFTHALIEGAVRDRTEKADVAERRRRIAAALEETRETDPGAAALIAAHWEAGGENEKAALAYLSAARVAADRYAYAESVAHAKRALALGLRDEDRFAARLIELKGRHMLGDHSQGFPELDEIDALAEHIGLEARREAMQLRALVSFNDREAYLNATERLAALAASTGRDDWKAEAQIERAAALLRDGQWKISDVVTTMREVSEFAQERSLHTIRCRATWQLLQWLLLEGQFEEVLARLAALDAEYERTGDPGLLLPLSAGYGMYATLSDFADPAIGTKARFYSDAFARHGGAVHIQLARRRGLNQERVIAWDVSAARAEYADCVRIERDLGLIDNETFTLMMSSDLEAAVGRFGRAAELLRLAVECTKRKADVRLEILCAYRTAQLELATGATESALLHAEKVAHEAEAFGEENVTALVWFVLGAAEVASGQRESGLEWMRRSVQARRRSPVPRGLVHDLAVYLGALLDAGRDAEAAAIAAELEPLFIADAKRQKAPGRIAVVLARAAGARGESAQALRFRQLGRRAVDYALSRLTDPEDRAAFSALPYNRELLRQPSMMSQRPP
jgi:DNA-binding SARP family transcriptional activator